MLDGDPVLDARFGGDMVAFIEAGAPAGATRLLPGLPDTVLGPDEVIPWPSYSE